MGYSLRNVLGLVLCGVLVLVFAVVVETAHAKDLNKPWRNKNNALVLDAYELNPLDWMEIIKDKRIAGFISKSSDGLPQKYCSTSNKSICGVSWRKYSVTRELYHTRRQLAKALGLKWGAYHLGRPNNPEEQARHFLNFAEPTEDEAIVLDIEGINPKRYMSLEDAEKFAIYINKRLGRYPMLYTNHATMMHITYHAEKYPILSRLKLWYARYVPNVTDVFPHGNWKRPTLWQFAYSGNCGGNSCPYRVKGAPKDIDVNVAMMSVDELKKAWPFDGLEDWLIRSPEEMMLANNVIGYPEEEKHEAYDVMTQVSPSASAFAVVKNKVGYPEEEKVGSFAEGQTVEYAATAPLIPNTELVSLETGIETVQTGSIAIPIPQASPRALRMNKTLNECGSDGYTKVNGILESC